MSNRIPFLLALIGAAAAAVAIFTYPMPIGFVFALIACGLFAFAWGFSSKP